MKAKFEHLPFIIDPELGGLRLEPDLILNRSTSLVDFRKADVAARAKETSGGPGWVTSEFELGPFEGVVAVIGLLFCQFSLKEISVFLGQDSESESWGEWSIQMEMRRKNLHDVWLLATLGPGPYVFDWGEVFSKYDEKGGFSEVIIRFV